jgi:UDP-N-acetylglucosamine/UDP-N-acetylgalactosamine diphosphorylase
LRAPADGGLKYNWSNVCMHYFQRAFLERMARQLVSDGRYHIANKKIPSKDGPVQVLLCCTAPSWHRRG